MHLGEKSTRFSAADCRYLPGGRQRQPATTWDRQPCTEQALSVISNLFFFSYPCHLPSVILFFSPPMHSNKEFDVNDADCLYSQPPLESQSGSVLNLDYKDGHVVDTQSTQHMLRPPLRSKPAMYFSGHHLAVSSEFSFSQSTSSFCPHPHAPSHMSGSTLRSTFDPSFTQPYTCKAYSPINPPVLLWTSLRHFLSLNFTKIQSTADSSTIMLNCAKHSLSTSLISFTPCMHSACSSKVQLLTTLQCSSHISSAQTPVHLTLTKTMHALAEDMINLWWVESPQHPA